MKISRFTAALAGILIASSHVIAAQDAPSGLLCNLLTQPERCVITEPQPDFGWIVPSSQTEDLQTAYQISVASSAELLTKAPADMWDSGKIYPPNEPLCRGSRVSNRPLHQRKHDFPRFLAHRVDLSQHLHGVGRLPSHRQQALDGSLL